MWDHGLVQIGCTIYLSFEVKAICNSFVYEVQSIPRFPHDAKLFSNNDLICSCLMEIICMLHHRLTQVHVSVTLNLELACQIPFEFI